MPHVHSAGSIQSEIIFQQLPVELMTSAEHITRKCSPFGFYSICNMLMRFDLLTSIQNTFQADTKFAIVLITGLHCVKWCQNTFKILQRLWTERLRIKVASSCQYANQLSGSANSKKFLIT
jgi:hypothetical protein